MMARDDDSLPMELIETILSRLPAKSLLRFEAVSKSWNNLISEDQFIRAHLQISKNSISQDVFLAQNPAPDRYGSPRMFSLLRLGGRGFQTEAVFQFQASSLLCSADGLVLLQGSYFREFVLWNPSCRKMTRFYNPIDARSSCGLCHDPTNEDLKIVTVGDKTYGVYSCKKESWMKGNKPLLGQMQYEPGVSVCGAVYWVSAGNYYNRCYNILFFDSRDDEIKMLPKPEALKNTDEIFLISLGDHLCVWFNNVAKSIVEIWIKEKGRDGNSWMEFMAIDNFPTPFDSFKPLHFQENKILIRARGARYLIYRPREKTFEEFEEECEVMFPYVDSLLFFSIQKEMPKRGRKRTYSRLQ